MYWTYIDKFLDAESCFDDKLSYVWCKFVILFPYLVANILILDFALIETGL